ncbi:hypothetical protein OV207_28240 [Corallococcus sp. BB11-1]|uniref:hypothetical protein n=1 Tax=Corallococcus sp. BB11-1 TaxID=2996783 RepID=UPI002270A982|nr:hypothetical protein [Corallococcus sp. BB11-1]MCY1035369.1 hypothetical protein [Corallococcus sp. BB11-1]
MTVATFLTSTLLVEGMGSHGAVLSVKRIIAYGLGVLVPAMAIAGGTGNVMGTARGGELVDGKRRRMKFIAANGLLVLVPCALGLHRLASAGSFGALFMTLQGIEFAAGAMNLFLLGLMVRDGLRLSGRFKPAGA